VTTRWIFGAEGQVLKVEKQVQQNDMNMGENAKNGVREVVEIHLEPPWETMDLRQEQELELEVEGANDTGLGRGQSESVSGRRCTAVCLCPCECPWPPTSASAATPRLPKSPRLPNQHLPGLA
jgi:hypothetical protein